MMEYTLARVALIMCGAIMLAAVVPPVTSLFENEERADMQEQAENISSMFDRFYESGADDMILPMNSILPRNSSLTVKGYLVTLTSDENEYKSGTYHPMTSDKDVYDSNDSILVTRNGDSLVIALL